MGTRTFGKVTIERRGPEGTVTVAGRNWLRHGAWHWLPVGGLLVAAVAVALGLPADTLAIAAFAIGFAQILSFAAWTDAYLRHGIVTPVSRLETYLKEATAGGYREPSAAPQRMLRLPHREVPISAVKRVTRTTRLVQPKDRDSYWAHRVYVSLEDEAIEIGAFRDDEALADACAQALAELLGEVPVRTRHDDPMTKSAWLMVGPLAGGLYQIALFVVAVGPRQVVAVVGGRAVGLAGMAALLMVIRHGVLPLILDVGRRARAGEVSRAFGIVVDTSPTRGNGLRFAASALAILAAAAVVAART